METKQSLEQFITAIAGLSGEVTPLDQFVASFESECQRAESLYRLEDRLVESFLLIDTLEKSLAQHVEHDAGAVEGALCCMASYEQSFQAVKAEFACLKLLCQRYYSAEGWDLVKNNNGIKTFFRSEPREPTVSIKVTGLVKAPLLNVIALIYENDLWKEWLDRLTNCDTVREISRFAKCIYFRASAPGPIAARDGFLVGQGYDLLEKYRAVVILARNATAQDLGQEQVPTAKNGDVRMRVTVASVVLLPVDAQSVEMTVVANADPFLPVIPYWLINWVTKNVAAWLFEQVAEKAGALPDKYSDRIKANPKVYEEVIARLKKYNLHT